MQVAADSVARTWLADHIEPPTVEDSDVLWQQALLSGMKPCATTSERQAFMGILWATFDAMPAGAAE